MIDIENIRTRNEDVKRFGEGEGVHYFQCDDIDALIAEVESLEGAVAHYEQRCRCAKGPDDGSLIAFCGFMAEELKIDQRNSSIGAGVMREQK